MSPNSSKPGTPFRLSPGIGHTSRAPSPSRSPLPPTLRPAVSFSSIRQKGHPSSPSAKQLVSAALPPHLSVPFAAHLHAQEPSGMESSASSIMNVEVGDGILMKDAEAEVETGDGEDGAAVGHIEPPIGDEEARKNLREHLRRTLTQTREKPTHEDEAGTLSCTCMFYCCLMMTTRRVEHHSPIIKVERQATDGRRRSRSARLR